MREAEELEDPVQCCEKGYGKTGGCSLTCHGPTALGQRDQGRNGEVDGRCWQMDNMAMS